MLILSREVNQVVTIGKDIEVKILEITETAVVLGFKAPRTIPVHREEVYKVIKAAARKQT